MSVKAEDEAEEHRHQQDGQHQRHGDLEERAEETRPVDLGGVVDVLREWS